MQSNKKISLKENNEVQVTIEKFAPYIRRAEKMKDKVALSQLRKKLVNNLTELGIDWRTNPHAVELIQEAKKVVEKKENVSETKNVKRQTTTKKPLTKEQKIKIIIERIEKATGKKVILSENTRINNKEIHSKLAQIGKEINDIKKILSK